MHPAKGAVVDKYDYGPDVQMTRHQLAKPGQIIVSEIWAKHGSIGVIPPDGDGALITSHFFLFDVTEPGLEKEFIDTLLLSNYFMLQCAAQAKGSTGYASIRPDDFLICEFPLPPIDEQRRIVEVLRDVDANIARVEGQIEAAQQVKRGVMQRLFMYGLAGEGAPTKETDTGKIPEHWSIEPLKKHTESSAFGPRFPGDAYADNGNIATLRTTDLDENGFINYETMPRATLNEMDFAAHILQRGDLTITRSGTIGIVSVFDSYRLPVVPGAFLIRFRLFDTVLPDFLRQYLNSDIGRRRVLGIAAGGVQKNLQGSAMLRLKMPVPPIEEQREIAAILNTHDATIRNLQAEAASLRDVKRGLMQKLLSGQIRI